MQTGMRRGVDGGLMRLGLAVVAACAIMLGGCTPKREPKASEQPLISRDVPEVLRGTIGAEATIRGTEPVLVSGLGVVVGLNGTGGGELPVQVQATMERELARGGIGKGGAAANTDLGPMSPQEFLRSPNVAVVIVQAVLAPGAPKGSTFDVFVRTLPGSSVSSLEGGTLWTTDLRFGEPAVFGAVKTRKLADARGAIFVNPFSGARERGPLEVTRTIGRVLGGGVVTDPLAMELLLDNESHARARSVVGAINSRFPQGRGELSPPARGRGRTGVQEGASQSIALTVPEAYKDNPADFIQLVRHLRIDQAMTNEYARLYVEEMKNRPALSDELGWCLQALGKPALPFLASLYDYAELAPRLAALEAGAKLGDARAAQPLADLARSGPSGMRAQAIRLMSQMPSNPTINLAMRELLSARELDVRVAAYEGLRLRNDPGIVSVSVGPDQRRPRLWVDLVPGGDPMVYVTQQGQPRVVLFGAVEPWSELAQRRPGRVSGLTLSKPMLMTMSDDRLMMVADSGSGPVRLMYRDPRLPRPVQRNQVPEDLAELVQFLAQKPTPEDPAPGLDLTYSEVVGLLYELSRQGGLAATFATEEDRLRAEIAEASRSAALADRPETTEGESAASVERQQVFKTLEPASGTRGPESDRGGKITRVVPINAGAGTKPKQSE